MTWKCKTCKLDYETEQGYELHRIAHLIKSLDGSLQMINKYIQLSTQATLKALKDFEPQEATTSKLP